MWLAKRSDVNTGGFFALTKTAGKHSQDSYSTVVCAIQLECIFLQWMKKYTGYAFTGVEKLLQETFLPRIFFGKLIYLPPIVGILSTMLVNKSGPDLQDPVTSANHKYLSLNRVIYKLIGAFKIEIILHLQLASGAHGINLWWTKISDDTNEAKLKGLVKYLEALDRHLILCAKKNVCDWP